MTIPLIQVPERRWECPNCDLRQVTRQADPHVRFHACSGLNGFTAPMLPAGSGARVVAHEREDYLGTEDAQLNDAGRPITSVTTEHPDGRVDCVVFPPTARAGVTTKS